MTVGQVAAFLDGIFPRAYAEDFDNIGLLCGEPDVEVSGVLVAHDALECVVDEAVERGLNLIVAYHPIIFKGLKSLTGRTYVERSVMKALRKGVAIYALHTALDNHRDGVSALTARALGLQDLQVLIPQEDNLRVLVTYVPHAQAESLRAALFAAGAGVIGNYDSCSYNVEGYGTFRPLEGAQPFVGKKGSVHTEPETRVSVVFPRHLTGVVEKALREAHPYEEPAYEIYSTVNRHPEIGIGTLGRLPEPVAEREFLVRVKEVLQIPVLRHSALRDKPVERVAVVGGSGAFAIGAARAAGADVLITGDLKYHDFFAGESSIVLVDAGHYETERFVTGYLAGILSEKFPNFAVVESGRGTNPVYYHI